MRAIPRRIAWWGWRRGRSTRSGGGFEVNHGGPSIGYSVIERRHKLKPEYADHSGPQLVALKEQGVEITRELELPLVAFCGDTATGDFLDLDWVRNASVLVQLILLGLLAASLVSWTMSSIRSSFAMISRITATVLSVLASSVRMML